LTIYTHTTLTLGGFFCEDVALERFLVEDFTCTGNFEALLCATVGFNLWHYITVFKLLPAGVPASCEKLFEPCGK